MDLVDTLISWLPFLLLIVVWIYLSRGTRSKDGSLKQYDYLKEMLEAQLKSNEAQLEANKTDERIAVALEKIAAKLELND